MNRRGLLLVGIGVGAFFLFGAALVLRSVESRRSWFSFGSKSVTSRADVDAPVPERQRALDAVKNVDRTTQGTALHDASLLGLIRSARVASARGDAATRGAMLAGLRKEPARAKQLIEQQITKSTDYSETESLRGLLAELP
jgi:hypothetical protein